MKKSTLSIPVLMQEIWFYTSLNLVFLFAGFTLELTNLFKTSPIVVYLRTYSHKKKNVFLFELLAKIILVRSFHSEVPSLTNSPIFRGLVGEGQIRFVHAGHMSLRTQVMWHPVWHIMHSLSSPVNHKWLECIHYCFIYRLI